VTPPASQARWNAARRELSVAAGLVIALTGGAWILLGAATAGIVALICVVVALIVMRTLVPPPAALPEPADPAYDAPTLSFSGYWRTQFELNAGTKSLSAWDLNTRRRLQNLLAARLAERHGISLTAEPEAAKAALIGTSRKTDLWYWIDPQRPTPADASSRPGIPPRTLAALIQRLEQL
jgi:hypothetical protein